MHLSSQDEVVESWLEGLPKEADGFWTDGIVLHIYLIESAVRVGTKVYIRNAKGAQRGEPISAHHSKAVIGLEKSMRYWRDDRNLVSEWEWVTALSFEERVDEAQESMSGAAEALLAKRQRKAS